MIQICILINQLTLHCWRCPKVPFRQFSPWLTWKYLWYHCSHYIGFVVSQMSNVWTWPSLSSPPPWWRLTGSPITGKDILTNISPQSVFLGRTCNLGFPSCRSSSAPSPFLKYLQTIWYGAVFILDHIIVFCVLSDHVRVMCLHYLSAKRQPAKTVNFFYNCMVICKSF